MSDEELLRNRVYVLQAQLDEALSDRDSLRTELAATDKDKAGLALRLSETQDENASLRTEMKQRAAASAERVQMDGETIASLRTERDEARAALWKLTESQPRALRYIRLNGFKWADKESIGIEPGNWQHLAFSLYSDLCEVDSIAREALTSSEKEKA